MDRWVVIDSHAIGLYCLNMVEAPYAVTVVVDKAYGERLLTIAPGTPVWIVDTPTNRAAAQRLWAERAVDSHLHGITTFRFSEEQSPEEILITELDTIDLHHGSYSARPPYTILDVIGTPITDRIKAEMFAFGFDEFHAIPLGFRAVRPLPSDEPE